MPGKTFKTRAIVLKKTKLGEKDLIVTMIDESGALNQAVAKGARKPGGSLASRVELFSTVQALIAQGKSLGVLADVRLEGSCVGSEFSMERIACASPLAELLCVVAQVGLPQQRLFDMTNAAFRHIADHDGLPALAVCTASLWKVMAQSGFRPCFDACAICNGPVTADAGKASRAFSCTEGGVVCDDCRRPSDAVIVPCGTIDWSRYLLQTTFDDITSGALDANALYSSLQLARQWIRVHTGRTMKSLDFLFTSGLF